MIPTPLYFVFMSFLGGLAYVLLWRIKNPYEAGRYLALGAIVGIVYFIFYSEHAFPNYIMAFVSGFAAESFLDKITEWRTKKPD